MKNDRTGTIAANGLRAAARTDCGRQRAENEDRYFLDLESGVFLVIDGVGGHAAGEVAARIAHDTIQKRLDRQDAPADVRVREAITLANQQILLQAEGAPERKGMACVLTLGVLEGRRLTVGHVGDTRLYRLSPDGIAKMTHDHSPIGEREDAREISETEAMQHARRNEVYRDVGSEPREPDAADFIEVVVTSVDDDVAVLMCSDGLSDMLPSLEINRIVREHAGDPARVTDALVDAANQAGGKDNITVLYVEAPRFAKTSGAPRVVPMTAGAPRVVPMPRAGAQVATEALDGFEAPASSEPAPQSAPVTAPASHAPSFLLRGLIVLLAGAVLGFGVALAWPLLPLPWRTEIVDSTPRELVVGGTSAGAFRTIGEALAGARNGDVIRVHPGRYDEALELRRSVTLISVQPQGAILTVPAGEKAWASVTVWSDATTLRGFRIASDTGAAHVGVRVHTGTIDIDDAVFEGSLDVGVDAVGRDTQTRVRNSRFLGVTGVPVQIGDSAGVSLVNNLFRAAPNGKGPAIACVSGTGLVLDSNIFMHFSRAPIASATGTVLVDPAFVIPPPAAPRGRRR